jgi:Zn-dependent protease with chaperone function
MPPTRIVASFGLLDVARDQDQLATVVGREVAHVVAGHHNARVSAAYATETSIAFWRNMAEAQGGGTPAFLSTHPSHRQRVEALRQRMPPAKAAYQRGRSAGHEPACG